MEEDTVSEFVGTCRVCGGNVNITEYDDEYTWICETIKCQYNEGEITDSREEPEWVD